VQMRLERDEFVITYDALQADETTLLTKIKDAGYTASTVTGAPQAKAGAAQSYTVEDSSLFTQALAQAQQERKPLVLDFYAEWCLPCKRMLKETFADPKVAALLERCVLLTVDTDRWQKSMAW
jgi:thiol:disulfide interchange protein